MKAIVSVPIGSYKFPSAQQKEKAKAVGATRIMKWGYTHELPKYAKEQLASKGYRAVQIGYTTYQSSTWALVPKK